MMRGMAKPKNWLNIPLNVKNIRITQSGEINPTPIPAMMAMIIFPNSPILKFFIWLCFSIPDVKIRLYFNIWDFEESNSTNFLILLQNIAFAKFIQTNLRRKYAIDVDFM
jgi:hypothetical protein